MSAVSVAPDPMSGVIKTTERLRNTVSGNPRWRIEFTDGRRWPTENDAQIGHTITPSLVGQSARLVVVRGAVTGLSPI